MSAHECRYLDERNHRDIRDNGCGFGRRSDLNRGGSLVLCAIRNGGDSRYVDPDRAGIGDGVRRERDGILDRMVAGGALGSGAFDSNCRVAFSCPASINGCVLCVLVVLDCLYLEHSDCSQCVMSLFDPITMMFETSN